MDALRWQRIDSVFQAVLEMPPAERDRYLAAMCEDEEVCQEVRDLLNADGQAAQFLETAAAHVPDPDRLVGPTLAPGVVLSERFRLVRFLAEGGMGEVYEAEDLELGENVAIKIVRPDVARDDAVMLRFRREVHLARQVTHRSVCRCFDIFRHVPATTRPTEAQRADDRMPGPITFLTMELIRGETLARWLEREGPMTTAQAWPILEQVAAALAAAHGRGIVHRDLKPSNVMLDRAGPALRVVVTDFGLALSPASSEELDRSMETTRPAVGPSLPDRRERLSITGRGQVLGTPAYMAPEQLLGAKISAATDIYALGALMYQMLTGHAPFEAETERDMALKRLSEPPPSPRRYLPDLDPRWERTILRCLERAPDKRFGSTDQVLASLREAAPRVRRSRWWMAAAAAAAMAGLGMVAIPRDTDNVPQPDQTAVVPDEVDVNHGLALAEAEQELRRAESSSDAKLQADAHLRMARARQHLSEHAQALKSAQTAEALYRELGDRPGQASALALRAKVLNAQSRRQEAVSLYQQALAMFEELGHQAGIVDVYVNLAPLLADNGDTDGAVAMLERAHGLARDVGDHESEAHALFKLAWIHKQRDQLDRALPLYEQALALAREQGEKKIESATLNDLGTILRRQGKLDEAEQRFWEALSIARAIDDDAGVSSRLNNLALTMRLQGKLDGALDKLGEALDVEKQLGDHARVAQRLTHMATILRMQGRLAEAGARLDQAMAEHELVDDPRGRASTLRCMGLLRLAQGDLSGARRRLDEAVAIRRQLGENTAELLLAQRARAMLAMEEGHLVEAERLTREIIDEHVALAHHDEELEDRLLLARLLLMGGRVTDARKAVDRARSLAQDSQDRERRLRANLVAAEVDAASGTLGQALDALDALARDANGSGMIELALEARLARAALALAGGGKDALDAGDALDTVIREAQARGFVMLEKKARTVKGSN